MSLNRFSALAVTAVFIFPSVQADRLHTTYLEMKQAARNVQPPFYYLESVKASQASSAGKAGRKERSAELEKSAKTIQDLMKSWKANAAQPASQSLFYDFNSASFKKARNQAQSKKLADLLAKPITLDFLLAAAFERNPKIASLHEAWSAAIERYPQSLYLDNILQQYNAFTKQLNTKTSGMQRQKEMVSTKFPFPGVMALKGAIINQDVLVALEDFKIGVREVMTAIRLSYYDYIYILRAIRITEENQKLLEDFESTARKKYEGNTATFNDVIKAQVELSKLSDDLITLRENRNTIIARINTLLLNRDPQARLGDPTDVNDPKMPKDLGKLYPLALKEQQEIQRIELRIEKMNLVIKLGSKMFYPDTTLGASYFEDRSGILAGHPQQRDSFNLSPSIKHRFWFGKDDAYMREVRKKRDQLREKLRAKKDKVHFDIKNTHFQLDAARRKRELYRNTLLPQASQNLQTARIAYQGAKVSFLDLLDAERLWLNFNLAYHRFRRNYQKGYARLEQVIGKRFKN